MRYLVNPKDLKARAYKHGNFVNCRFEGYCGSVEIKSRMNRSQLEEFKAGIGKL